MVLPDFWDVVDAEVSNIQENERTQEHEGRYGNETYQNLDKTYQKEDMETMIEMGYEENDPVH